jgi:hypothetical protein
VEFLVATGSQSRNATCAGSGFLPVDDGLAYGTDASLRFSQTAGGVFRCSASLPDGASVTAVRFSVEDSVAANIGPCRMVRTSLVSSIGAETVMADAGSTSGTPGGTRLSDTSVASPNIDNANFAYFLTCTIGGTDNQVGVYGASIAYTISNAAG